MKFLLVLGATLRLTRLITTDDLGQWWIKDPIDRAAEQWYSEQTEALHNLSGKVVREGEPEQPWWWKYRSGLDCPWCVGYWIGTAVLSVTAGAHGTKAARPWNLVMASLALSYLVGHVGARLDGPTLGSDEDEEKTDER